MTQSPARVTRLLVVDHSPTARERLRHLFDDVPDIDVVAEAGTVDRSLRVFEESPPNAVLMDCDMPKPGSFVALEEMMSLYPVPVIMFTKDADADVAALESQALAIGAVAVTLWTPRASANGKGSDGNLIRTVRAMSEVKVVRRRGQLARVGQPAPEPAATAAPKPAPVAAAPRPTLVATAKPAPAPVASTSSGKGIEIVAIGASTGGPPVLQTVLSALSRSLPVPIVLVQHLSRGFQGSLVSWLSESTGFRIVVGEQGALLAPGIVYLAPDDKHMTLDSSGRIVLNTDPPENGSRPSVSVLFRSVAQHYGPRAVGILLTGMGRDGAKELRLMRDKGAVTIAQDEETSVVHGMPGEAIRLKGARYVLPPERIPSVVEHHVFGSSMSANAAHCR